MLDDLLGRGFSSKLKSLIKAIKTRIEAVRKKRNATHKFLKKDIAHLLANGLDINAFARAEGLVTELILSSCYDFVEHCCECLLKNLSAIQRKREFSEDCNVAVASLMFAAARFSDLPELRDLRKILQGRYGNSYEYYINQQFVKNISGTPATMESKMQLLVDIADQYSITWNAKAFEQRMSMASVSTQNGHMNYGSSCAVQGLKTTNNYKEAESDNCTSLRGLFDRPNLDSKENANSRNEQGNENYYDQLLSINVNKAFSNYEDDNVRKVEEPVLPFVRGKNVTEMLDPNNRSHSSRRGIEISDDREAQAHNHRKFRGNEGNHTLDSHIDKEQYPSGSKTFKARSHKEFVKTDRMQSSSFSHDKKVNIVKDGHRPLEITESATPKNLAFYRDSDTCSAREQQLCSENKSCHVGSLVSFDQAQQKVLSKGQVQAGNEAKIKHFHPPPYVKSSKVVQDTLDSDSTDAKHNDDSVTTPQVSDVDHTRLKSSHRHDGISGQSDNPKYAKSTYGHGKPPKASKLISTTESSHNGLSQRGKDGQLDAIGHIRSKSGQFDHHELLQVGDRGRTMNNYRNEGLSDHDHIARFNLPKPRATRRRRTRSSSSNDSSHIEGSRKCGEKTPSARTSHRRSRRSKNDTLEDTDIPIKDEDKLLDNLLIHYSSKPLNLDKVEDAMKKSEGMHLRASFPPRSVSLPREQSVAVQPKKVFTRAATFQLDRAAQHVHPKLPDYDDLAARFSAMKAKY